MSAEHTSTDNDHYSKALLRLGKMAPEAWPMQNAQMIRIERLQSNPRNPRLTFNPTSLQELGDSMQSVGVIEPLVVRYIGGRERMYEIIVGERRWRAARKIKISELPCLVRELDDIQAFELALSENILREELSPLDEARCYQHMLNLGMASSLRQIARKVGVSHTRIQQKMNLMGLEREFQRMVATRVASPGQEKRITEGHARHLLRLKTTQERHQIIELILKNNWSTRETETKVSHHLKQQQNKPSSSATQKRNSFSKKVEKSTLSVSQNLSIKTCVQLTQGALNIRIQYDDPKTLVKELESLLQLARSGELIERSGASDAKKSTKKYSSKYKEKPRS